jgi:hypothetical protein
LGKLKDIPKSAADLSEYEESIAKQMFNQYIEVDESQSIDTDELRSILLNLNLDLSPLTLEDYKEAFYQELGADSSRSGEQITWPQFRVLYCLILRNQSTFFREIYSGKRVE